jgi:hypothetical protein
MLPLSQNKSGHDSRAENLALPILSPIRRVLAVALMATFAAPSLALLCAGKEPSLPACCRRDGKHHCMGRTSGMVASGTDVPAVRDFSSCCPYRLQRVTQSESATPQVPITSSPQIPAEACVAALGSNFRYSYRFNSNSQRGPPSFSSSPIQ